MPSVLHMSLLYINYCLSHGPTFGSLTLLDYDILRMILSQKWKLKLAKYDILYLRSKTPIDQLEVHSGCFEKFLTNRIAYLKYDILYLSVQYWKG